MYQSFELIKQSFPNEWVLLGNPQKRSTTVIGGIVLYHSKDKKEVCYIGKDKTSGYNKITLTYTGELKPMRRVGIMKRL
jgi:hypothetical protein